MRLRVRFSPASKATAFELVAHGFSGTLVRAYLVEESLVGQLAFRYRITAVTQLGNNFCFSVRQHIRIFAENLNDFVR